MTIETRKIQEIPLSLLSISKNNMRLAKGIDDSFVKSIKHNGVVQALVVTHIGSRYEVVAGRRRLHALKNLLKNKDIDKAYPVPCTLCTPETAARLSIVENMHRTSPHPTEYYKSINGLKKEGATVNSICECLQLSQLEYDKIIRLANLHPRIFKAYEKGELDEQQVKAFGATDDTKKQLDVWKQSDYSPNVQEWVIRRAMQSGLTSRDSIVKYVGIDSYTKAGGTSTPDLFNDLILVHDAHLIMDSADKKLSAALVQCKSDEPGWKWYAKVLPDQEDNRVKVKGRYRSKVRKPSKEQKSKYDAIDLEMKSLTAVDEDDWTEEQSDRYDALEILLDEVQVSIEQENEYFLKKEMANSGLVITVGSNGALHYDRGIQTSEDLSALKKEARTINSGDERTPDDAEPENGYSHSLQSDVDLYLRAMSKAQLVKYPDIAIELLNYSLIVDCFDTYPPMIHSIRTQVTPTETTRNDFEESTMFKVLKDACDKLELDWLELEVQKERIDAYISLPVKSKKSLLAYVSANTFQSDLDDYIRTETELDVREYWAPTKDNYFSRIARPLLLSQVRDIVGDSAAKPYIATTKKVLVDYIAGIFEAKPEDLKKVLEKWVPPLFK